VANPQPEGTFYSIETDTFERVVSWRRTTCEQALYYRDHMARLRGKVRRAVYPAAGARGQVARYEQLPQRQPAPARRRNPDEAMWLKYVDPDEAEGEHYEVYEQTLARMAA
jgi:hypothetical protein